MGCTEAAIIYSEGPMESQDRTKALALFDKGCGLGSSVACKDREQLSGAAK
jgi:TPR repeat protein